MTIEAVIKKIVSPEVNKLGFKFKKIHPCGWEFSRNLSNDRIDSFLLERHPASLMKGIRVRITEPINLDLGDLTGKYVMYLFYESDEALEDALLEITGLIINDGMNYIDLFYSKECLLSEDMQELLFFDYKKLCQEFMNKFEIEDKEAKMDYHNIKKHINEYVDTLTNQMKKDQKCEEESALENIACNVSAEKNLIRQLELIIDDSRNKCYEETKKLIIQMAAYLGEYILEKYNMFNGCWTNQKYTNATVIKLDIEGFDNFFNPLRTVYDYYKYGEFPYYRMDRIYIKQFVRDIDNNIEKRIYINQEKYKVASAKNIINKYFIQNVNLPDFILDENDNDLRDYRGYQLTYTKRNEVIKASIIMDSIEFEIIGNKMIDLIFYHYKEDISGITRKEWHIRSKNPSEDRRWKYHNESELEQLALYLTKFINLYCDQIFEEMKNIGDKTVEEIAVNQIGQYEIIYKEKILNEYAFLSQLVQDMPSSFKTLGEKFSNEHQIIGKDSIARINAVSRVIDEYKAKNSGLISKELLFEATGCFGNILINEIGGSWVDAFIKENGDNFDCDSAKIIVNKFEFNPLILVYDYYRGRKNNAVLRNEYKNLIRQSNQHTLSEKKKT